MARKRWLSNFFWFVLFPLLLGASAIVACNLWIVLSTHGRVYASTDLIEAHDVGLVLGTSKNVAPDTPNQHFQNRLAAAAKLYEEGKVTKLLVSGYRGQSLLRRDRGHDRSPSPSGCAQSCNFV